MGDEIKTNLPIQQFVITSTVTSTVVSQNQLPLLVNNASAAVLSKFLPTMSAVPAVPVGTNSAVAVIPAGGAQQLPILDGGDAVQYGGSGVIYALSQYSPFISIPRYHPSGPAHSPPLIEDENSNLGPEDTETKTTSTSSSRISPSSQEQPLCNEPGKCQAGGEVRLTYLADHLENLKLPDGFVLVGAKSPMLIGMTLVAAVDRRYLPSEGNSVAMLGFSGNCIGCGATGFRYFTEFSTHINLKLATQPKKQKHLKYYILKDKDGKWTKGALIPWKGTETRKRNLPLYNSITTVGRTPELLPPYTMYSGKDAKMSMLLTSDQVLLQATSYPMAKKPRVALDLNVDISSDPNATVLNPTNATQAQAMMPGTSPKPDPDIFLSFKMPISAICGVRPVLLLCQNNNFKLPNNINDIIISDLLHGCFDSTSPIENIPASTESTFVNRGSIMATGSKRIENDENIHSRVEQNAASTLISMSSASTSTSTSTSVNNLTNSSIMFQPGSRPHTLQFQATTSSALYQQSDTCGLLKLPVAASVLILIQYLSGLDEYNNICREEIEALLQRARMEMMPSRQQTSLTQFASVATSQLNVMANLLASSSKGRVKVINSTYSLQNGIFKALRWVHDTFVQSKSGKARKISIPNFLMILSTPSQGSVEFCVLVTGITHAKLLAEALGLQGIVNSPFDEDLKKLVLQFKQTEDALNMHLKAFSKNLGSQCFAPYYAYAQVRVSADNARVSTPTKGDFRAVNTKFIFANQAAMAEQLLSQLCNIADNTDILELPSFARVELLIVVPHNMSLYHQTIKRLCESGILLDLGLENEEASDDHEVGEKYVLTYSDWQASLKKWEAFVKKVMRQSHTLFMLVFDQSQSYCLPQGMPDVLPSLKEVFESINVIPLFVTAVPYIFQSRQSFIDPDNEVYWTDARNIAGNKPSVIENKYIKVNDQEMIYFGIKEYADSAKWCQQYPLIRHEETFDLCVPRANRYNDIPYNVVHGFLLTRLYRAALMVAAGIKPAEQYCVLSAIQMTRDIVEAPLKKRDGSGYMLLIRVPNTDVAKYCYNLIKQTRDKVGFQYRFDVIYDDGQSNFELDHHFLERMRAWRRLSGQNNADSWFPGCLEELLDLPCFVIYAGKDRAGQTFPRSLKYCDLRLVDSGYLHRSAVEAEIGSIACYLNLNAAIYDSTYPKSIIIPTIRSSAGTTYLGPHVTGTQLVGVKNEAKETQEDSEMNLKIDEDSSDSQDDTGSHFSSRYPLPIILASKTIWQIIQSHGVQTGWQPKLMNLNSDPNTRWVDSNRPVLANCNPDHQSRYYRRWTAAREARKVLTTPGTSLPASPTDASVLLSEVPNDEASDEDDSDKEQFHPRCLLLSGPPQVGKTGAYLHFARLLHGMLMRLKRVDVYDNRVSYAPALDPMEICGIEAIHHPQWPDVSKVSETEFITEFLDSEFKNFSRVHISSVIKDVKPDKKQEVQMLKRISDVTDIGGQQVVPVILADCAAHDTLHHCDSCKFYREGMGGDTTKVFDYQLKGFGDDNSEVELQFIIPVMHMKYFLVDEEQQTVQGLFLPKINVATPFPKAVKTYEETLIGRKIKTPILMASSEGEEEGLLNLFHAMEETDYVHITFVKQSELSMYQKNWPNHVFVVLPPDFDDASFGAVKQVMKHFGRQNYEYEVNRQNIESNSDEDIWPLVLMVADNVVMWQQAGKNNQPVNDKEDEIDSMDPDALSPSADTTSLFDIMKLVEATPHVLQYGIIGLRPWSSAQFDVPMHGFIRTFVHSCVFMNIKQTYNICFKNSKYIGENIDFQLRLVENNILTCRFEHLSFMCKVTARSGWRVPFRSQKWENMNDSEPITEPPYSHLVAPPDIEYLKTINAPSHLVMQTYLRICGNMLFPASVDQPDYPVLIIGGYVDLGEKITICVINGNLTGELNEATKNQLERKYGGLLLYDYPQSLEKEFLSKFKFIDDARLCIISNDRYRMREEINRLDLEENWRFRFRDEYQTATLTEGDSKPVFFLTGVIDL
eukprot:gene7430-13192_t